MRESWMSARAISSRRFMPEESVRTSRSRQSDSSTSASISSMRFRRRLARHAVDEAVEVQVLVDGQPVVEARLLEHDAEIAPRVERTA